MQYTLAPLEIGGVSLFITPGEIVVGDREREAKGNECDAEERKEKAEAFRVWKNVRRESDPDDADNCHDQACVNTAVNRRQIATAVAPRSQVLCALQLPFVVEAGKIVLPFRGHESPFIFRNHAISSGQVGGVGALIIEAFTVLKPAQPYAE